MNGHRDLIVWQKAMDIVTQLYKVTRSFPKCELYGLVSQMRRAAVSVPSNIAEGYGRNSRNELHHFVGQARGSLSELETQVEIAKNLGYLEADTCTDLLSDIARVGRLLTGLRDWSANSRRGV